MRCWAGGCGCASRCTAIAWPSIPCCLPPPSRLEPATACSTSAAASAPRRSVLRRVSRIAGSPVSRWSGRWCALPTTMRRSMAAPTASQRSLAICSTPRHFWRWPALRMSWPIRPSSSATRRVCRAIQERPRPLWRARPISPPGSISRSPCCFRRAASPSSTAPIASSMCWRGSRDAAARSSCSRSGPAPARRRSACSSARARASRRRPASPPAWRCTRRTGASRRRPRPSCAAVRRSSCEHLAKARARCPSCCSMSIVDELLQKLPLERFRNPPPQVAVLRLDGLIGMRGPRGLSLRRFAAAIERAFALRRLKAVALVVNSPGGSPAQSSLLFRRIRQLAEEHEVPVVAFAEDVAASGGYWLALAADEVFADETSLLGSIGVITASFGFTEALRKLGVQRRLYTAGDNKSMLDPFLTEDPKAVERLTVLQRDMHEAFKDLVRSRRGARLKGEESVLFSGEVFTGRRALELGLIDGIGDLRGVMRQRFGDTVRLVGIEPERRRFALLSRFGFPRRPDIADIAADLLTRVEERLIWARFGL